MKERFRIFYVCVNRQLSLLHAPPNSHLYLCNLCSNFLCRNYTSVWLLVQWQWQTETVLILRYKFLTKSIHSSWRYHVCVCVCLRDRRYSSYHVKYSTIYRFKVIYFKENYEKRKKEFAGVNVHVFRRVCKIVKSCY